MKYTLTHVVQTYTASKKIDHAMLQKTIWCSKAVWDTTYSELPANRSQLLNPSVKCITTEDTIKLLSLFPNSNFSKQVSHICTLHTPSHPSILDRCIHVQVSTTIVQVTSAHLKVPTTFFMYLHQVSVSTGHFHSPARCIYNYNLYPLVFTNYLKLPITQI